MLRGASTIEASLNNYNNSFDIHTHPISGCDDPHFSYGKTEGQSKLPKVTWVGRGSRMSDIRDCNHSHDPIEPR